MSLSKDTLKYGRWIQELIAAKLILNLINDERQFHIHCNDAKRGNFVIQLGNENKQQDKVTIQFQYISTRKSTTEKISSKLEKKVTIQDVNAEYKYFNPSDDPLDNNQLQTLHHAGKNLVQTDKQSWLSAYLELTAYQFQVDAPYPIDKPFKVFLENFYLCPIQSGTKDSEADLRDEFKQLFKCDDKPAIEFIDFVRKWFKEKEETSAETNEKYFASKLAECLVIPLIADRPEQHEYEFVDFDVNEQMRKLPWEALEQCKFDQFVYPTSVDFNLHSFMWNEILAAYLEEQQHKAIANEEVSVGSSVSTGLWNYVTALFRTKSDDLQQPTEDNLLKFCASECHLPVPIDITKINNLEHWKGIKKIFQFAGSRKKFIFYTKPKVKSTQDTDPDISDADETSEDNKETLLHHSKNIYEVLMTSKLVKNLNATFIIGSEEPREEPTRDQEQVKLNLSIPCIDFEFLKELHEGKIEDSLVMVICENKSELKKFKRNLTGISPISSSMEYDPQCKIYVCIRTETDDPGVMFHTFTNENIQKKGHLLQFYQRDNRLIWIKSTNSVEDLQSHRLKQEKIENQDFSPLSNSQQKIKILCGISEEKRSFFFEQLIQNCDNQYWILRLHFHHYRFLPLFQGDPDHISFLRYIVRRNYGTDNQLLLDLFETFLNQNKIILVWDDLGDDPFEETNREYILRAIEEFRRRDITQWIITPAFLRYELETRFNALAIHCEPFISQDHIGFLPFSSSENAEDKHSHCGSTPELLERYDCYLREKIRSNNSNSHNNEDQLLENYGKAALRRSLEESVLNEILSEDDEQTFIENIVKRGDKCGIIRKVTSSYIPLFEHRSISDYLTACYLAKNRGKIKNLDFLFLPRYRRIRFFFDLNQAEGFPLHTAILYHDKEMIQKCSQADWKKKDRERRTPLALAASWGKSHPKVQISTTATKGITITHVEDDQSYPQNEIVELLMHKQNLDSEIDEALALADNSTSLSVINTILKYNPRKFTFKNMDIYTVIYYSIRYGYSSIIDNLDSVPELNKIKTRNGDSLWHLAAFYKNVNFFQRFGTPEIFNKFGQAPIHIATKLGNLQFVEFFHRNNTDINICWKSGPTPLRIACERGHLDILQYFLKNISFSNPKDKELEVSLLKACEHGHLEVVEEIINFIKSFSEELMGTCLNNAALNNHLDVLNLLLQECLGYTLVREASTHGHLDIVKYLIVKGADINETDKEGRTCLWWAACGGHLDVVQHLVLPGNADVHRRDKNDCSPLWIASREGHLEIVKFLVGKGCDISCRNKVGDTPFKSACQSGHLEVVKYLQQAEAKIKEKDVEGCIGLWSAAYEGHLDIVNYLIQEGVNTKRENQNGLLPLHAAAQRGHLEIVKLLTKDQEEAIHATTSDGQTPLHLAAQYGHSEVVKYLKEINAAIDSPDHSGFTPLHLTCFYGHLPVVEYLAGCGADINTSASDLSTPISAAASHGYLEIVTFLAREKAFLNRRDLNRATPIQLAARKGHDKIVKYLLDQKVNPDSADIFGRTVLWEAAYNNHLEIVKLLASHGAYLNSTTQNGFTPLHAATRRGNLEMVKWLLDNGADPHVRDVNGWSISCTAMLLEMNELLGVFKDRNIHICNSDRSLELPLHDLNLFLNDNTFKELY